MLKKILGSILTAVLLLAILEMACRCVYFQRNTLLKSALLYYTAKIRDLIIVEKRDWIYDSSLYADDPVMGFRLRPGHHDFRLKYTAFHGLVKKDWAFTVDINPEGYRYATNRVCPPEARPVWLFGCSYTMGWFLQYEDTFAFHFQDRMTNYCVKNYAVNGYGNLHWLLQLRELLSTHKPPAYCIFAYHPMHLDRNVAAPSFINMLSVSQKGYHYPRAYLDPSGRLSVDILEVAHRELPEPDLAYKQVVAKKIFSDIKSLCDTHGIQPVLAVLRWDENEAVLSYCRQLGFHMIDITVYLTPEYKKLPFDAHPNEKAQLLFAEKLAEGMRALE